MSESESFTPSPHLIDERLEGRHALVSGASRGIGRAAAFALAGKGARVTLFARDVKALAVVAEALPKPARGAHTYIAADFDEPSAPRDALASRFAELGRVDVLVNNSGGPPGGPITEAEAGDFELAFRRLLLAAHGLVQVVAPDMKEAGFGRIINVVSTSVYEPIPGLGVSNTIRAAVAGWAKTLSRELAPFGITVNNVLPGATNTERLAQIFAARAEKSGRTPEQEAEDYRAGIPAGRFAEPEETAAAIAWLASPAASYVTGVSLPVDGGRLSCL